jgi:hypothetical protein
VGVRFGSGGSGWIGLRPVAGVAGAELPRRRCAGNSSEFIENDAPGVKTTGFWARELHHAMRDRPRALAGLRGALGCAHNGGGGGGNGTAALAGVRCSGLGSGLCAKVASAKGTGWGVDAHRGLGSGGAAVQGGRRRWRAVEMRRCSWRGLLQGFSGLLGSTGQLMVFLRWCYWGQEGRATTDGEESRWRSNSPAAVLSAILALHGSGSRVASLGSFLAVRRGFAGFGRGWGAEVWRDHGGAGALRGGARWGSR